PVRVYFFHKHSLDIYPITEGKDMKLIRGIFLALLSMVLVACGSDSDKKNVSVSINPTTATVSAGATQTFTANVLGSKNTAVTWRVNEADGGSITSTGVYTAP